MELKLVHEDLRRALYEFGEGGTWKVAKYLEVKQECTLGDHYHKNKDELFLLVKGGGILQTMDMDTKLQNTSILMAPRSFLISRNTLHTISLYEGSVLMCLASELHDPSDDHKLQ